MPPYRANLGGVFGSGLYDRNRPTNGAAEVIDAVSSGANTLIQGAYHRALTQRDQARADAEQDVRNKAEARAESHDAWEKDRYAADQGWRRDQQARLDAQEGYTPQHTEQTSTVTPGEIESHGLTGPPPTVTAPSAQTNTATIPGAYNFTASREGKLEQMKIDAANAQRKTHLQDERDLIDYRESARAGRAKTGADSPTVHAATEVRNQIAENNTAMKALQARRQKLAPDQLPQDVAPAKDLDDQIGVLKTRGDSLSTVNDRIGSKLTDDAGVSRSPAGAPTIASAFQGAAGGSVMRGGGAAASSVAPTSSVAPATTVPSGATRLGRQKQTISKQTISQAEYNALLPKFGDQALQQKYNISQQ